MLIRDSIKSILWEMSDQGSVVYFEATDCKLCRLSKIWNCRKLKLRLEGSFKVPASIIEFMVCELGKVGLINWSLYTRKLVASGVKTCSNFPTALAVATRLRYIPNAALALIIFVLHFSNKWTLWRIKNYITEMETARLMRFKAIIGWIGRTELNPTRKLVLPEHLTSLFIPFLLKLH